MAARVSIIEGHLHGATDDVDGTTGDDGGSSAHGIDKNAIVEAAEIYGEYGNDEKCRIRFCTRKTDSCLRLPLQHSLKIQDAEHTTLSFHLPSNQTLSYIPGLQLSPSPPDGCHPPDPSSRALCRLGGTHPRLLVGGKLGALPPRPPPPPPAAAACLRLSRRCECSRELSRDFVGCDRCIKLQKLRERGQSGSMRIASFPAYPPLVHSPISFCRQQASLKSVTGESSAYRGLPDVFTRQLPTFLQRRDRPL